MHVVELDLNQTAVTEQIFNLQQQVYGQYPKELLLHVLKQPPLGCIAYGIYDGQELVSVTTFIAHSVHKNGSTGVAYQACGVATRQDQSGKGCFSRIVDYAKTDLIKKDRAAFIFGYPNKAARPIWVKKKSFSVSSNLSVFAFRSLFGLVKSFNEKSLSKQLSNPKLVTFDAIQAAQWKRCRYQAEIFEFENLTNYLFGRVTLKRFQNFNLKLLVVGAMEINKPHQANRFLRVALRTSGAHAMRLVTNSHGPIANSAFFKRGERRTEPTICFGLNWEVHANDLEAFGGLKDVY